MQVDVALGKKLVTILPYLNEKQRRLMLAVEARTLGYGGITQVARLWSIAPNHPEGDAGAARPVDRPEPGAQNR